MSLPVLVELVRSGVVESTHTGSVVALRADGSTALSLGVVDRPVFPRSSNKPLQAVGLLLSIAIYYPFIRKVDRMAYAEEQALHEAHVHESEAHEAEAHEGARR